MRSVPVPEAEAAAVPGEIEQLLNVRNILASRGLNDAAQKLDRQIAVLRARRARPDLDLPPAAVLEISASRSVPQDQKARLIVERRAK